MESLTPDKGIFMYSKNLDSSFMLKAILSLLDIQPGASIAGIYNDKIHNGFRVYFEERKSTVVLRHKYLLTSKERLELYPLNSFLTIHDIYMGEKSVTEDILRQEIEQKFGTVLSLESAPQKPATSYIKKNWRVEIAVPELSTLSVFERNGFPEMVIELPNKSRRIKVTFWCRRCEKDDHTLQDCLEKGQASKPDTSRERMIALKDDQNNIEMMPGSDPDNCNSIHNAQIIKEIVDQSQDSEQVGSLKLQIESYPENLQNHDSKMNRVDKVTIKTEPNSEFLNKNTCLTTADGSNNRIYSDDDDIQVVDVIEKTSCSVIKVSDSKRNMGFTMSGSTESKEAFDNSSSHTIKKEEPEIPSYSSNQPIKKEEPEIPSYSSDQPLKEGELEIPAFSSNIPRTSNQLTNTLSQFLQDCFMKAYDDYSVLDARQLDAFLIHVKKKSTPIRVASNYTHNTAGLKDQLKQISYYYYNTPQTGTKEDILFMKWLTGVIERFEGTIPKKRKKREKKKSGVIERFKGTIPKKRKKREKEKSGVIERFEGTIPKKRKKREKE